MKTIKAFLVLTFLAIALANGSTRETWNIPSNCPTVIGNGVADDTIAMQNCLNNLPDYYALLIPAGYNILISSTLTIQNKHLALTGMSSHYGGPSIFTNAPAFYWGGPSGGKMMYINCVSASTFSGLSFFSGTSFTTGTGGASVIIDVDQSGCIGGQLTTDDEFLGISITGVQQNPSFVGIRFSATSAANVDHITVGGHSRIFCANGTFYNAAVGVGISNNINSNSNALKHLYTDSEIASCGTAIYLNQGSADVTHMEFESNALDIQLSPAVPVLISGNNGELGGQFAKGAGFGSAAPVTIENNRIAGYTPPSGVGVIQSVGQAQWTLIGNGMSEGPYTGVSCSQQNELVSIQNHYPDQTNTVAGFYTCAFGSVSMGDTFVTINGPVLGIITGSQGFGNPGAGSPIVAGIFDLIPQIRSSAPPCAYLGEVWYTTTSTTAYNICLYVSGTLTWVTK